MRALCALGLVASALGLGACSPVVQAAPTKPAAPAWRGPPPDVIAFPARPSEAPAGRRFVRSLTHADETGREQAILKEIGRGNIPESLRHLIRIDFKASTLSGKTRAVTLWVTRDYLAVGTDADNVRMPMGAVTAQLVADAAGCLLPTTKIVDIIYDLSAVKLAPRPFQPGPWMVRTAEFARHNEAINAQLRASAKGAPSPAQSGEPGGLMAGHKKDIVISNRLEERPHRVAIYGWHTSVGHPIQPLSTAHGDWYSDYSHGVRLIGATMLIDGEPRRVADVLRDAELSPLLSDEGALVHARYRTEDGPGRTKWWPDLPAKDPGPSASSARPGSARAERVE